VKHETPISARSVAITCSKYEKGRRYHLEHKNSGWEIQEEVFMDFANIRRYTSNSKKEAQMSIS
jgi:hypothetical protein